MSELTKMLSANFTGLTNDQTYYARVYPMNRKGAAQSEIGTQIGSAILSAFPLEPITYNLIDTYSSSRTWVAPEDGWFKIEAFGASGNGGNAALTEEDVWVDTGDGGVTPGYNLATGGGGASGGYACSIVKMNKGDTVVLTRGAVGSTTKAVINSSLETYSQISITSGGNGGNATATSDSVIAGSAGTAGSVSGGNVVNTKGKNGSSGTYKRKANAGTTLSGGSGGAAVVTGANSGGNGAPIIAPTSTSCGVGAVGTGKNGFFKIYRGNTNVVA